MPRQSFLIALIIAILAVPTSLPARDTAPRETTVPDLRQIMADPEWMGPRVESAWWQLDGQAIHYRVKRTESSRHDIRRLDRDGESDEVLDFAAQGEMDGADPVLDADGNRAVFVRSGNLFLRDLERGALLALTRGTDQDRSPRFSSDGQAVQFLRGQDWWSIDLESGAAGPVADLRFEESPEAEPEDGLEADQLRLFRFLRQDREEYLEEYGEQAEAARQDPTRSPAPFYLGEEMEPAMASLSPDGRWMLLVVQQAGTSPGKPDVMPNYVTRSGYVETEEVRTLVGRDAPAPQKLWLLDLRDREKTELSLDFLDGLDEDPLADLKETQDITPHDGDNLRPVRIPAIEWHPDGQLGAVMVRSIDNKDRWLATVDTESGEIDQRHRLTDEAWINWAFNDFGWLPESQTLWFLSEETGFSHFYTTDARSGSARQHTSGDFKVSDPVVSRQGSHVFVLGNQTHPTEYDLYRLDLESDELTRLTELRGLESFVVHPLSEEILLLHSSAYTPTQLARLDDDSGQPVELTDTRSEDFRAIEWQYPEIVGIESTHGAGGPIWSKFYRPEGDPPEGGWPVVMFVHGAGYLQNTHYRYPQYFREQMFHNLLTDKGYLVLDMDFRASQGYGRDWRTAIYRQMGTPELEDLIDGVQWLVDEQEANPDRVGLYGGSYGGFMAFMGLFNAPDVFTAGAALRPVTDWAHYSHPYTSNILNTPEVDPEAYRRSSPIEMAENLEGHLLITHGMLDDNVFYQDVVRMTQRLIELEKENWELATYPLEPHGFEQPESWLDQYRRILNLFESTIGNEG